MRHHRDELRKSLETSESRERLSGSLEVDKLKDVFNENDHLKQNIADLNAKLEQFQKFFEDFQNKIAQMDEEKAHLHDQMSKKDQEIRNLEEKLDNSVSGADYQKLLELLERARAYVELKDERAPAEEDDEHDDEGGEGMELE
eukprot:TRINITY_DN3919_c0_g1_i7.p1 TRINITY_DN3919_c0_g1~~TRINITY_DN3919_c0_g1_i7.p1  ORF type:complete len:143 (-),score=46.31 TRINITY_DN3919_c0_g1_i7:122-550(-)